MNRILFALWLFLLSASQALAQDPCVGVPGGCSPENYLPRIVPVVGQVLVGFAAGGAVLFVVFGGFQMIMNFGSDPTKGKMTVVYALCGFALALSSQAIVTFVNSRAAPLEGASVPQIELMGAMVSAMLNVFNVTFVVMVVYAGFQLIISYGKSSDFEKAQTMLIWAVVGALVVNAGHALVNAVLGLGL
ncbi:MAG: hypothetical protein PHI23_00245 [Candidatus Peribacteraceae bacterium]|nr:hypothetical protein [Candidatus Peribacteraceae bacterium]